MEKKDFASRLDSGLGWRLSKLGEKLGLEYLIYNPFTFRHFHRVARESAPSFVIVVRGMFPAMTSIVDVGAGSGAYAAEFMRSGVRSMACEHNPQGRAMARKQGVTSIPFDLTKTPPAEIDGKFDMAYSLEVAEHLPPHLGEALVGFLTGLADTVLFSAAIVGQGGHGHINEQPLEYWAERFAKLGFHQELKLTQHFRERMKAANSPAWWLERNMVVYSKDKGQG